MNHGAQLGVVEIEILELTELMQARSAHRTARRGRAALPAGCPQTRASATAGARPSVAAMPQRAASQLRMALIVAHGLRNVTPAESTIKRASWRVGYPYSPLIPAA